MRVRHEGIQYTSLEEESAGAERGTRYTQSAVLIPGLLEWKPAPLPKPRVDGPHMATVVGPPGEQIYCDEWGRVKVSFPWDRASQSNEFSSCWVRVSQGWAGGQWGSMAIPRIGQEVIIHYVNADPDQPLITGRTYSGTQLPPYELPKHKTRMTIKSQTHKGKGFNELRFEDELGQEEVFIHAQRDRNNVVKHDESTDIGHDRSETVGNDEKLAVGHDQTVRVANNAELEIGSNHEVKIGANLQKKIGNNRADTIGADHQSNTGGNSEHRVKGLHKLTAGQGMGRSTTVYELQASERLVIKGPGGSIIIDATGIHLKGVLITQEGPLRTMASGEGQQLKLELLPEVGATCMEKSQ